MNYDKNNRSFEPQGWCRKNDYYHQSCCRIAAEKKRVLLIDMDGQANLTESCGLSIEEEQTVYGAMKGEYPYRHSSWEMVFPLFRPALICQRRNPSLSTSRDGN